MKDNYKKIPKLLKNIAIPGSPFASKPQAPPLGNTPMPKLMASANIKNPQTNLTRTEEALLSPKKK